MTHFIASWHAQCIAYIDNRPTNLKLTAMKHLNLNQTVVDPKLLLIYGAT